MASEFMIQEWTSLNPGCVVAALVSSMLSQHCRKGGVTCRQVGGSKVQQHQQPGPCSPKMDTCKTRRVMLLVNKTQTPRHSERDWQLQDVSVEFDSHRFHAYIARAPISAASDVGKNQQVFAHLPFLGTYIEYQLYSLLSYGESLRTANEAVDAASDRNIKAPIPCKVLSVLKKDGESVRPGEIVMVLESMKMEMNILTAAKGTFKANFRKGDAVEESMVLFAVS